MSLPVKSWRTAFLTLRDETLASPPRATVLHHLNQLILSQSDALIAAAPELPPHEVTSDLMLLMELAQSISHSQDTEDVTLAFVKLSHLVDGVSHCASIRMNSKTWDLVFDSLKRIMQSLLGKVNTKSESLETEVLIKATRQCLENMRLLFGLHQAAASVSECVQLLSFLIQVVGSCQGESMGSSYLSNSQRVSGYSSLWEFLTVTLTTTGEIYSKSGSCVSIEVWQSMVEVLQKVVDISTSKSLLLEHDHMAVFYVKLLHCLHLVLTDPKGSLAGYVSGFVAAFKKFFRYGLINKACVLNQAIGHKIAVGSTHKNSHIPLSSKSKNGPYRPPHLRKKVAEHTQRKNEDSLIFSGNESSSIYPISSDSDCSDSDGSVTDDSNVQFAKARLAAIVCIQDLCQADPKSFTAQWTMLLPSSDVLQHRQYETTLMSCLLFDPNLKVRISAGSTIMAMLDGPASVSLQVAELRGSSKFGSFTALSSSLGLILMQLHSGILYLIKHETHSRLLALLFKILVLLESSTPYSRMPEELLSTVISSVISRIEEELAFQSDRSSLLATALNCLTIALSISPPSTHVKNMLMVEVSKGFVEGQEKSGVLYTLFRYSEQLSSLSISLEAYQALKALAHNYPSVMVLCWDRISSVVERVIRSPEEVPERSWRGNFENTVPAIKDRAMTAAIKVLDECLRAISGFKGTEDISNDKFLDSPFTSDYMKTKSISSAPSYSLDSPGTTEDESKSFVLASERWSEATVKHLPVVVKHSSAMVRAASVTCFAGLTSSVFNLLPKDKQKFVMSCCIDASLRDEVPSVRSAACRAIGVIACFPQIYESSEVLEKFVSAAESNTHDPLLSVRITASWAIANICDSLGHCTNAQHSGIYSTESKKSSQFISLLVDCALRLARDNDKVKANAVRALGNLSRFVEFTNQSPGNGVPNGLKCFKPNNQTVEPSEDDMRGRSDSFPLSPSGNLDWLQKMVQAFLSCVATGNVKVQWNVCHALSKIFSNKTVKLKDMEWASSVFSILLLLLRDSSNFKIKIQAAAALAVPENIDDYGTSYYDVVKGVAHIVENFKSDQISVAANFKYWIALEKQLTSTMLHLLHLAARCNNRTLQDFLTKKASFLEGWIKNLCLSLDDASSSVEEEKHSLITDQKKDVLCRTIHSLVEVYKSCNQLSITQRFDRLASMVV